MYRDARILIVEDERISAEYLKEILELNNFEVVGICDTGEGAVEEALKQRPDVIFMDIMLKDRLSGSEAAMQIAANIRTKIIFLTSYLDEEMIEYAFDAGAVNYLIKPFLEKQIIAALQIALNKEEKRMEVQTDEMLQGGYRYSYRLQKLFFGNDEVDIGKKSLRLIGYLCKHQGRSVPHEMLSTYVYGEPRKTSALRTLVSRVRKAIGNDLIVNSSGEGYRIALEKEQG